jgi:hypothetical protein
MVHSRLLVCFAGEKPIVMQRATLTQELTGQNTFRPPGACVGLAVLMVLSACLRSHPFGHCRETSGMHDILTFAAPQI